MSTAPTGDEGRIERRMRVTHVRVREGHAQAMFAESARIYRLDRDHPEYAQTLKALRQAVSTGQALRVRFDQPNGEVIVHAAPDRTL